jgi:hypothetical protein
MESLPEQRLNPLQADPKPCCGRGGLRLRLAVERALRAVGLAPMAAGSRLAIGGLDPLSRLRGGGPARGTARLCHRHGRLPVRRPAGLRDPPTDLFQRSRDEATLVALCGLAQGDLDGPLVASLEVMMAPTASCVAAIRLKAFAGALGSAGLRLGPPRGDAAGRLN